MTVQQKLDNSFSRPAGEDLRGKEFLALYQNAGGSVQLLENGGTLPVGVLYNNPNTGLAATVAGPGCIVKCVAGAGGVDEGQNVMPTTGGKAIVATGTVWTLGDVMSAAASGEVFTLHLNIFKGVF